jgi:hypothetical protein
VPLLTSGLVIVLLLTRGLVMVLDGISSRRLVMGLAPLVARAVGPCCDFGKPVAVE